MNTTDERIIESNRLTNKTSSVQNGDMCLDVSFLKIQQYNRDL